VLTGNWIFAGKQVPNALGTGAEAEIWAVPLAGGAPRLAFAFEVPTAGIPEAIFDNQPYLRRQFSPDGRRMVVNSGGLAIVDLETGSVRRLGIAGYFPAWSKDGSKIAFLYYLPVGQRVPPDEAVGVVSVNGGPITEIANVGWLSRQGVEWSPDGSMLMVAGPEHAMIVDPKGTVVRTLNQTASFSAGFAHWRAATPQIAIAAATCQEASTTSTKVIGLDDARAPERVLLDGRASCPTLTILDPRWSPANTNELLYVATHALPGAMADEYRAHILDVSSSVDTVLPIADAYEATWTWDGGQIAYVTARPGRGAGNAVRIWRRDGTGTRDLLQATENDRFFSLASVSY
jgi:hypothetical protein